MNAAQGGNPLAEALGLMDKSAGRLYDVAKKPKASWGFALTRRRLASVATSITSPSTLGGSGQTRRCEAESSGEAG
jgi:hypothetical protein